MKGHVLFVDDEPTVLDAIKRSMVGLNYTVSTTTSANDALTIMQNEDIHVIVVDLDLDMDEKNGLELLEEIRQKYPSIVRLVLTGFGSNMVSKLAEKKGGVFLFLTKPISREELHAKISGAFDFYTDQNGLDFQ